jgi:hypothetical protein
MKRLLIAVSLFCAGTMAFGGTIAAQTPAADSSPVDTSPEGEAVLAIAPGSLIDILATTPDDALLPDGFLNPPAGTPAAGMDVFSSFSVGLAAIPGTIATITHGLNTDPALVPGLLSAAILTYIVTDHAITDADMTKFQEDAERGISTGDDASAGTTGSVTPVTIGDRTAINVSVTTELSGIVAGVQIVAIPIGNTMAVATVISANQGEVDMDTVYSLAESLGVAAVANLVNKAQSVA